MENEKVINVGAWLEYNKAVKRYRVRYMNIKGETHSLTKLVCGVEGNFQPYSKIEHQFIWKWEAKQAKQRLQSKLIHEATISIKNLDKWEKVVD